MELNFGGFGVGENVTRMPTFDFFENRIPECIFFFRVIQVLKSFSLCVEVCMGQRFGAAYTNLGSFPLSGIFQITHSSACNCFSCALRVVNRLMAPG